MHMNSGRDAQQSWLAVQWDKKDFSPAFLQLIYLEAHPRTLHLCTQYFYIPRHLLVGSRYIRLLFSVLFKNFNGMPKLFINTLLRINRDVIEILIAFFLWPINSHTVFNVICDKCLAFFAREF